jgi:hypothetical protein
MGRERRAPSVPVMEIGMSMNEGTCDLLANIDKIHTTRMGADRIAKNLGVQMDDVVEWCKSRVLDANCKMTRRGKNWYARVGGQLFTINAYSYTIITAHVIDPLKEND